MQRLTTAPRLGWQQRVKAAGLVYDHTDLGTGNPFHYWNEGTYYQLTTADVEVLDTAARSVFDMCVQAGDWMLEHPEFLVRMGIPVWAHPMIRASWNRETPDGRAYGSVYGRFDVCFGGVNHPDPSYRVPRLYEFNADTPTCLVESSTVQWDWKSDTQLGSDQWNAIFEDLIDAWRRNTAAITTQLGYQPIVYFSCSNGESSGEDELTVIHLQDACEQAGLATRRIYLEDVGLGDDGRFYDSSGFYEPGPVHLDAVCALYPWEMLVADEFGHAISADAVRLEMPVAAGAGSGTWWIEPPYKMLWSNKALLVVLWQLFGHNPAKSQYLLPTYFDGEQPPDLHHQVRKPLLGREGANVQISNFGTVVERADGPYGGQGYVIQSLHPLPQFFDAQGAAWHPMTGIWMIDGEPSGVSFRESSGLITTNTSLFVPHVIE